MNIIKYFRKWNFREVNIPREKLEKYQCSIIGDLVYPRRTVLDESLGSAFWFAALGEDELDVSPCRVISHLNIYYLQIKSIIAYQRCLFRYCC